MYLYFFNFLKVILGIYVVIIVFCFLEIIIFVFCFRLLLYFFKRVFDLIFNEYCFI